MFKNDNDLTYFAARDAESTASTLLEKSQSFYNVLRSNAYLEKMRRMWAAYHGLFFNDLEGGHSITFTGEQGEYTSLPVNHFRNLAQHMYNMVTSARPVMDAKAVNTDYKSLAQTSLANGILDYYMREKNLETVLKRAVELSIVMGAAFVKMEWNATAGEQYDFDETSGEFNYQGDVEFSTLTPFDVVVDGTKETWSHDWIMTRTWQNKFNLAAKYPELADKIKAIPSRSELNKYRLVLFSNDETDDIPVYEFYHKRTEAMPEGRYMLFLQADIVLLDIKLPYRVIPIFRITPGDILGTPYGYSPMFDVFPIQEGINALYSTIMTNQNNFGTQNLFVPRGSDLSINSLYGGMNVIEGNEEPKPMNFTATPSEVFKFLEMLIGAAETISGINSVTRGNPEASLKSGNALALVQSMAIQFISGLQQGYVKLIEDTGTALIQILKDFATSPRVVSIVGKNNRYLLKEFTGEDINSINRVFVDMGNPLSRCLAKDTPVLMYDGSTKMVQDIKIGDLVMGPDSSPRTVENANSGTEMMYEVTSKDKNRDIKYGCNESHILTLKYCSDDYRYDAKAGDIIDISVREYLELPARHKRLLQGFTTAVDFKKKEVPIPAYILGAWLGDGHSATTALTSMDSELVNEWTNYANSIGMKIRVQENKQPNKSKIYHITSGLSHGNPDRNPMMNILHELELIKNKHIPSIYLRNSRKNRLELLAGLIDTDGHRIDETFIFTQKNKKLVDDVVFLSKSLGFRTTVKKFKSNSSKLVGEIDSECYKVSIGGNTHEIPTRLPRKQARQKDKARDWLNYGINVTPVGIGTYYGFTLAEEPHFLLGDFTVTHNTTAGRVQMAEQLLQMSLLRTPAQYFQVINTGRLDSTFEGDMSHLMLIKRENEDMMAGLPAHATFLDQHSMHIQEHRSVLDDPDLRQSPNLVENVLTHIQEHINLLQNTDPQVLMLIHEQPMQVIPPNPMAPGPVTPGEVVMPPQPPPLSPPMPLGAMPMGGPMGQGGGIPPLGSNGIINENMPVDAGNPPKPGKKGSADAIMNPQANANAIKSMFGESGPFTSTLPNPSKPPKPFQHLPIDPADNYVK